MLPASHHWLQEISLEPTGVVSAVVVGVHWGNGKGPELRVI